MNYRKLHRLPSDTVPKPTKYITSVYGMTTLLLWTLALALVQAQPAEMAQAKEFKFKVALLQMSPDKANVSSNLAKAERFCRQAAEQGADLALMPEMWSIGYTDYRHLEPGSREAFYSKALRTDSPPIQKFSALAKELNMAIGLTYMQAFAPAPRNVITIFGRCGRELFTYAKIHTCDFRAMERALTPGDMFCAAALETTAGALQIGAMICFDREFPESARILMLRGAEIILTPNASTLKELHLDQFKIRAWENSVGVAMANYPLPLYNGHSVAYDAAGQCLVEAGETEGLFMAIFDVNKLRELRSKSIWGNAYRRPHRYQLLTNPLQEDVWRRRNGPGATFEPAKR